MLHCAALYCGAVWCGSASCSTARVELGCSVAWRGVAWRSVAWYGAAPNVPPHRVVGIETVGHVFERQRLVAVAGVAGVVVPGEGGGGACLVGWSLGADGG